MSEAKVNEIHALEELRTALMRYKSEAQNALTAVTAETNRFRAWLQERLSYWQNELKRRRRALEEALAALAACEAVAQDAAFVVCAPLQAEVMRARRRVEEAENELRTVQIYLRKLEDAFASYERQARQLATLLENDLLKASALLSRSTSILWSYASGSSGISSGSGGTVGSTSTGTETEASETPSSNWLADAGEKIVGTLETTAVAVSLLANVVFGPTSTPQNIANVQTPATVSAEAPVQSPLLQGSQPANTVLSQGLSENEMKKQEQSKQLQEINDQREALEGFGQEQKKQNEAFKEEGKIVGSDAAAPQIVAESETSKKLPKPQ